MTSPFPLVPANLPLTFPQPAPYPTSYQCIYARFAIAVRPPLMRRILKGTAGGGHLIADRNTVMILSFPAASRASLSSGRQAGRQAGKQYGRPARHQRKAARERAAGGGERGV